MRLQNGPKSVFYACPEYDKKYHGEMYRFFCSPEGLTFLREKKLYQLYKSFYKTPVQFLHFSLPDSLKSELYYNYYTFLINYKKKYGELPPCTS